MTDDLLDHLPTNNLPEPLVEQIRQAVALFIERSPSHRNFLQRCLQDPSFTQQLVKTWVCSQYAAELCQRQPQLFQSLVESGDLVRCYRRGKEKASNSQYNPFQQALAKQLAGVNDGAELNRLLRCYRQREMLRIIWRDINKLASLQQTMHDMSDLADAAIEHALAFHHQQLCNELGEPCAIVDGERRTQRMLVLGMGKLGARELNLSSDVDLIFAYPAAGETMGDNKTIDNQDFFTRLGHRLIQSLDQVTADGFVFRVDMRLRPYGKSGSLVLDFNALRDYYRNQGRDWERYAMVKARVVAGAPADARQLMHLLRKFTYRPYADYSIMPSLRSMKLLINREVAQRRLHNNIKLGPGGIREIEFIAQSFQLIRGGRDAQLQHRELLKTLALLAEKSFLTIEDARMLSAAYIFLRQVEHRMQAFADRQTQTLPQDKVACLALCTAMDADNETSFDRQLTEHRDNVSRYFQQLMVEPEGYRPTQMADDHWHQFWYEPLSDDVRLAALREAGHEKAEEVYPQLQRCYQQMRALPAASRERFMVFMPLLLQAVIAAEYPSLTLLRILPLVEAALQQSAHLSLLVENPTALKQLVVLCAASPWISAQLARHPVLLDELIDATHLYTVPEKDALRDELVQQLLRLPNDDLEANMEVLRYFKLVHVLRVATCEISGQFPLMQASDYLSFIAEVILEQVLELAWHHLEEKYGRPQKSPGSPCDKDFIIIGYGKLGGIELGYNSDLDLVFVQDSGAGLMTDGESPIDNDVFFARLGQQIIFLLSTPTPLGKLYEVDVRLRPSGTSGMLVSSFKAFTEYQQNSAWIWEHQALVRARVVTGDPQLQQRFIELRKQMLAKLRDLTALRNEVQGMRKKMRDHLLLKELQSSDAPLFDLKQSTGGIVDIEFMVQYAVLAWSHCHPALVTFTDNVRILEGLQHDKLLTDTQAKILIHAYKVYRAEEHRLSLLQQEAQVSAQQFAVERESVIALWQALIVD